jgi:hypothetical protein
MTELHFTHAGLADDYANHAQATLENAQRFTESDIATSFATTASAYATLAVFHQLRSMQLTAAGN